MSLKRKRFLSLKEKVDLIVESEKFSTSARKLAAKFGVGRTQVIEIIKNKSDLKKLFNEGCNPDQRRQFPKNKGLEIDQAVYNWFCNARNQNIPVSGPLIKEQALEAAQNLKISSFKASNGWLDKFCKRHNISLYEHNLQGVSINTYASIFCNVSIENTSCDDQEIISELTDEKVCDVESERDVEESEVCTSNIKDMGEVCDKLRDIQKFLSCHNKTELAVEISKLLEKCESQVLE